MAIFQSIKTKVTSFIDCVGATLIVFFFWVSFLATATVLIPAVTFAWAIIMSWIYLTNRIRRFLEGRLQLLHHKGRTSYKKLANDKNTFRWFPMEREGITS